MQEKKNSLKLEGPIEEYTKVANMIGSAYKKKK